MHVRSNGFGWRVPAIVMSVLALLLAGFAAGLAARAAFAQLDGETIYACKGDRSGSVRLVSGPADCLRGEAPVSWNQQGPPGEPGISDYQTVRFLRILEPGALLIETFPCPEGLRLLDGGFQIPGSRLPVALYDFGPSLGGSAWSLFLAHEGGSGDLAAFVNVTLICANVTT